jgi:hypothetical protein
MKFTGSKMCFFRPINIRREVSVSVIVVRLERKQERANTCQKTPRTEGRHEASRRMYRTACRSVLSSGI